MTLLRYNQAASFLMKDGYCFIAAHSAVDVIVQTHPRSAGR
jgi:hypothetical protein